MDGYRVLANVHFHDWIRCVSNFKIMAKKKKTSRQQKVQHKTPRKTTCWIGKIRREPIISSPIKIISFEKSKTLIIAQKICLNVDRVRKNQIIYADTINDENETSEPKPEASVSYSHRNIHKERINNPLTHPWIRFWWLFY